MTCVVMVVKKRVAYLKRILEKGAKLHASFTVNAVTQVEKVKLVINPLVQVDPQKHQCGAMVLDILEKACSRFHVADRGHKSSTGESLITFYVSYAGPCTRAESTVGDDDHDAGRNVAHDVVNATTMNHAVAPHHHGDSTEDGDTGGYHAMQIGPRSHDITPGTDGLEQAVLHQWWRPGVSYIMGRAGRTHPREVKPNGPGEPMETELEVAHEVVEVPLVPTTYDVDPVEPVETPHTTVGVEPTEFPLNQKVGDTVFEVELPQPPTSADKQVGSSVDDENFEACSRTILQVAELLARLQGEVEAVRKANVSPTRSTDEPVSVFDERIAMLTNEVETWKHTALVAHGQITRVRRMHDTICDGGGWEHGDLTQTMSTLRTLLRTVRVNLSQ